MYDRYSNAREFIEDCETGLDIEFSYKGVKYGVFGWFPDGPMAYRQGNDNDEQIFSDARALLDGYIVDGRPLGEIITEVDVELH